MQRTFLNCLTLLLALLSLASCDKPATPNQLSSAPSTPYSLIISSGVITAGYLENPPSAMKDPNTGKLTGIHVEALEKAAAAMGLKVEWVPASGWGTLVDDIKSQRRYQITGCSVWPSSSRGKSCDFSTPLYWTGICAYVRADDKRFDNSISSLNSEQVRVATIDGEMAILIAKVDFPKAQTVSLPENSDKSLMIKNVVDGKADVTFIEPHVANLFLKANPGTIRNITPDRPLRVFPDGYMLPKNDPALKSMLDTALLELKNSGEIDKLIKKYAPESGGFFLDALPYRIDDIQR